MRLPTIRAIVFCALFTALTVVLDLFQINLGISPVPITLGNLGVMLSGAILGARYGFFSQILLIVLTAIGLPMLDGKAGLGVLLGPTGGYVWMWPICALLTGWISARARGPVVWIWIQVFLATEVFGSLLDYVTGVPWLEHVTGLPWSKAMVEGCYLYLIGDLLKAALTAVVAMAIRPVFPPQRITGLAHHAVVPLADSAE